MLLLSPLSPLSPLSLLSLLLLLSCEPRDEPLDELLDEPLDEPRMPLWSLGLFEELELPLMPPFVAELPMPSSFRLPRSVRLLWLLWLLDESPMRSLLFWRSAIKIDPPEIDLFDADVLHPVRRRQATSIIAATVPSVGKLAETS